MRLLKLLSLLAGATLLALLLRRYGLAATVAPLVAQGWRFALVLIPTAIAFALFAAAWRLLLRPQDRVRTRHGEFFLISTAGLALNYLLPFSLVIGEPLKAWLLARRTGRGAAVASVVAYNALHVLSHLLVFLVAALLGFRLLPQGSLSRSALGAIVAVLLALITALVLFHRSGICARILAVLEGAPAGRMNPLGRMHEQSRAKWRERAVRMDEGITAAWRTGRGRFLLALLLDTAGRAIWALELTVMMANIGQRLDPLRAFVTQHLNGMLMFPVFWVPYELGVKEGGMVLCLRLLGCDPSFGVYLSVASRLREGLWIVAAFVFLMVLGVRPGLGWLRALNTSPRDT